MLEKLLSKETWNEFLQTKLDNEYILPKEKKRFQTFIEEEKYLTICEGIVNGTYTFSTPKKKEVLKEGTNKKRIVYFYKNAEMIILSYLAYLMKDYDYLFADNLYSYRKHKSISNAVFKLKNIRNLSTMYGYKLDITSYFNNIKTDILFEKLEGKVEQDIYDFMKKLLSDPYAIFKDKKILDEKGVVPGQPLSAFLSNFYLTEADEAFEGEHCFYARYADDIILFANTQEEMFKYRDMIRHYLIDVYKQGINPSKECFYNPGDVISFLGFEFSEKHTVDVAHKNVQKLKHKIYLKAKALNRWRSKKNVAPEKAVKVLIRYCNQKFFGKEEETMAWKYWYFPYLNTDKSLKEIDSYVQEKCRYLISGKNNKGNFRKLPYEKMKELKYQTLINSYYKFKKGIA